MTRRSAPPPVRPWLWALVALPLLALLAPLPLLQAIVQGFLLVALLPLVRDVRASALMAVAAGWIVEGSLRLVPHGGGTAWANLTLLLLMRTGLQLRPPESKRLYVAMAGLTLVVHGLLVHGALALANGPHAWGTLWLWTAASSLAWGPLAWRLYGAYPRR